MYIDISDEKKKESVLKLFMSFSNVSEIYKYYNVSDNGTNCKYISEICQQIGFDKEYYKTKKIKTCLNCGNLLKRNQKKFCSRSCSNSFNDKKRMVSEDTKKKTSNSLKIYHEKNDNILLHGKYRRPLKLEQNFYDYRTNKIIKTCSICGCIKENDICPNYELVCRHGKKSLINNLSCFGNANEKIGTKDFLNFFNDCCEKIKNDYYNDLLSSNEIKEKYSYPYSVERLVQFMKSIGINFRNYADSSKVAIERGRIRIPHSISNFSFKTGWHTSWNGKKVYYRSSYELTLCEQFDLEKLDYTLEELRIPYYDSTKGKERIAIPDFFIQSENKIIEVKSRVTFNKQNMIDKFNAYLNKGFHPVLYLDGIFYSDKQINNNDEYDFTLK